MKTFSAKPLEVKRDWYVVDGSDKVLGRKPEFTPHVDTGDYIVVINADKIKLSAEKAGKKPYYRHTGYPGGVYETTFQEMQAKHPGRALEIAVKGMLPKGPLGYAMIKKLKIYAGTEHPHTAQQPKVLDI